MENIISGICFFERPWGRTLWTLNYTSVQGIVPGRSRVGVSPRVGGRRGDFSMVRRGWRDSLHLGDASAEAKVERFVHLGNAAPSGTIENVGCERPPEPRRP